MNIEQPLEGMTWGELRAFVALGHGYPDHDEVEYGYPEPDNDERVALAIHEVPPGRIVATGR